MRQRRSRTRYRLLESGSLGFEPMSRPDRIDVLFVTTDLQVGGAEHQLVELAVHLTSRGWSVAVVSLKPLGSVPDRLVQAGIHVEHLGLDRAVRLPRAYDRLRRIQRRVRPGLVHSHMIHANLLARATRVPSREEPALVCTSHSDGEGSRARRVAMRLTDRLATRTTHVSKSVLDRYVTDHIVSHARAVWIPNGVDLDRFSRSEHVRARVRSDLEVDGQTFLWLTVGTLRSVKRHDLLIEAFERLDGASRLLVAGAGDERPALEARISTSRARDRISLLGLRADPEALMSAADGFVLSSDSESLPLVLAEAAGCELPIVATDVGGCAELIEDAVTGLLVGPGNPVALAQAMASIEERTGDERAAMGRAGRESMLGRSDIDQIVDRWVAFYASLGLERPAARSNDGR